MHKSQRLEVEHLVNDGAKDWSHRKGISVAAAMLAVTALCCAGLHACYPVPPRAPAAARGHR